MTTEAKLLVLALVWGACAVVYSTRATATSCGSPTTVTLLELDAVEVDGQALTDLNDYQDPALEYVIGSQGPHLEIGDYTESFDEEEAP